MKICLRRGYHSVYDELVNYPPSGVNYIFPKFVTPSKQKILALTKRALFRAVTQIFKIPNQIYVDRKDSQLIHSGAGMLIRNKFPWVIDLEHVASFVAFRTGMLEHVSKTVENYLSSPYCKKIMPWTKATENSLLNGLNCTKFKNKIEVVYPAMHFEKKLKRKRHDGINLLFVSIRFFTKGGKELLESYDELKKKYDVSLTVVSDVPGNVQRKYPDVEFLKPKIPRKKLLENFYTKSDILVVPSYMDTFGMVFLEAMSQSIPIVSSNCFAIPEMIKGAGLTVDVSKYSWYGKNYLFRWNSWRNFEKNVTESKKPEIVKNLTDKISELIKNDNLRRKLGKNGRREIEKGKFSIERRNKKLQTIYENSLSR